MFRYFFDTSAITKFYHHEAGSPRVAHIILNLASEVRISSLAILELQSAFAMKVRTGALDEIGADEAMGKVFQDVSSSRIVPSRMTQSHLDLAQLLVAKHGYKKRLRSLDAIQLAVALDLRALGKLDVFVAADKALVEVADLEGLTVENPEVQP